MGSVAFALVRSIRQTRESEKGVRERLFSAVVESSKLICACGWAKVHYQVSSLDVAALVQSLQAWWAFDAMIMS